MGFFERGWKLLATGMTFYSVYKTLNNLNVAKTDLYNSLSPDQQAQWNKIIGNPAALAQVGPAVPAMPPLKVVPKSSDGTTTSILPTATNQATAVKAGV